MRAAVRAAKLAGFQLTRGTGLNRLVAGSAWRRQRLLVLCYHGVSIADEHEWNGDLYVSQEFFRQRMQRIREGGYQVLRLDEAVTRLHEGTLPPRAVAITVDDGAVDFALRALPVLEEFGFPATVYLTTHYCGLPYPVWVVAGQYLLWKGRAHRWVDGRGLAAAGERLPIATAAERTATWRAIRTHQLGRSTREKDEAMAELAGRLGVDYEAMRRARMFQIMTPSEVRALPRGLVDVELHTHRHVTPMVEGDFEREIMDNRRVIQELAGHPGSHFCYTSGFFDPCMRPWLRRLGVRTATTCIPGLATARTEPLELPRLVDTRHVPEAVFDAWLSGVAAVLPAGASTRPPVHRPAAAAQAPGRPDISSSIPS